MGLSSSLVVLEHANETRKPLRSATACAARYRARHAQL